MNPLLLSCSGIQNLRMNDAAIFFMKSLSLPMVPCHLGLDYVTEQLCLGALTLITQLQHLFDHVDHNLNIDTVAD